MNWFVNVLGFEILIALYLSVIFQFIGLCLVFMCKLDHSRLHINNEMLCLFPSAELKVRHKKQHYQYNHTVATILVEYASAVSFMGILYVQPLRCVGK